jgi:hypothetical protein
MMPADEVLHLPGPIPRIFETDEGTYAVVIMKLMPDNVIDMTISIDEDVGVPLEVTAAMLHSLAHSMECEHG